MRLPLLPHQQTELEISGRKPAWGLFWEMGTAKSRTTIDTAAILYRAGEIDAMFVIAPKAVHRAWIHDQAEHLPEDISIQGFDWWASRQNTKAQQNQEEEILNFRGLSILAMSYSGIMTDAGRDLAKKLLTTHRCLFVLDESHFIKDPGAKRTKRILAAGKYAPYRRILTGTFLADNPFDAYTQLKFLNPGVWKALGISDSNIFRAYFGVIERRMMGSRSFNQVVGYRNLNVLNRIISEHGTHLMKEDVLDLPEKTYSKRYFELAPEHRRVYERLRKEMRVELESGSLTLPLAIVRIARLQQAACGYLPTSDENCELRQICDKNPRLELLFGVLEEVGQKQTIVWAKYRRDIDIIMAEAGKRKISAVRYDGACSDEELISAKANFCMGSSQLFVSNPAVGGTGLNLTNAKVMVFYSCGYKLAERLQAEARFHRVGQMATVMIIDLVGVDTVDSHVVDRLRTKLEVIDTAMGNEIRTWI